MTNGFFWRVDPNRALELAPHAQLSHVSSRRQSSSSGGVHRDHDDAHAHLSRLGSTGLG